jgi:hypothetical protein
VNPSPRALKRGGPTVAKRPQGKLERRKRLAWKAFRCDDGYRITEFSIRLAECRADVQFLAYDVVAVRRKLQRYPAAQPEEDALSTHFGATQGKFDRGVVAHGFENGHTYGARARPDLGCDVLNSSIMAGAYGLISSQAEGLSASTLICVHGHKGRSAS